jgi:hypothetical protein
MCKEDDNKAIVGRWFKDFWSTPSDLTVVDELAAPDVLLQYSPDTPRRGRDAVRAFRASLRDAFPDLAIAGASPIADASALACHPGLQRADERARKKHEGISVELFQRRHQYFRATGGVFENQFSHP